eukprot:9496237-Pyramimonas_sp.AAC.1
MLAYPSHGSWPHMALHRRFQWQGPHAEPATCWDRHPFRHTPHTARAPTGSSTDGHPFRHAPHTVYGPTVSSTESPSG